MRNQEFVTVDAVLAKFYRDLKGTNISELDAIEWIGEALGFMKIHQMLEQVVSVIEVRDYQAPVPCHLHGVLQIARDNNPQTLDEVEEDTTEADEEINANILPKAQIPVPIDCNGQPTEDYNVAHFRPFLGDFRVEYGAFIASDYYQQRFSPVRLANHTLYNSLVYREKQDNCPISSEDEYTIIGTLDKLFRFSFQTGRVAVSYTRTPLDEDTGYPLVPDTSSVMAALTYYLKWKLAEWYQWNGRSGFTGGLTGDLERKWLKYVKQAKNSAKMPKGIDQYQNMLEETHHLIPRLRKYYGYFGNLGRTEPRYFNDRARRRNTSGYGR